MRFLLNTDFWSHFLFALWHGHLLNSIIFDPLIHTTLQSPPRVSTIERPESGHQYLTPTNSNMPSRTLPPWASNSATSELPEPKRRRTESRVGSHESRLCRTKKYFRASRERISLGCAERMIFNTVVLVLSCYKSRCRQRGRSRVYIHVNIRTRLSNSTMDVELYELLIPLHLRSKVFFPFSIKCGVFGGIMPRNRIVVIFSNWRNSSRVLTYIMWDLSRMDGVECMFCSTLHH